jgi:hypothetical protein
MRAKRTSAEERREKPTVVDVRDKPTIALDLARPVPSSTWDPTVTRERPTVALGEDDLSLIRAQSKQADFAMDDTELGPRRTESGIVSRVRESERLRALAEERYEHDIPLVFDSSPEPRYDRERGLYAYDPPPIPQLPIPAPPSERRRAVVTYRVAAPARAAEAPEIEARPSSVTGPPRRNRGRWPISIHHCIAVFLFSLFVATPLTPELRARVDHAGDLFVDGARAVIRLGAAARRLVERL